MKRPLAIFGFTMFASLISLVSFGSKALACCACVACLAVLLIFLLNKKLRRLIAIPTLAASLLLSCLLFLAFQAYYEKALALCGDSVKVEATVCENPYFSEENSRYYCVVKVKSLSGELMRTKMRLSFSRSWDKIDPAELEIGSKLTFDATVYQIGAYGGERFVDYYKSVGIFLGAYAIESLEISPCAVRPVGYYIAKLRDNISDNFLHDFDNDVAAVLTAILSGEKDFLEDDLYDAFKKSGVVHIMAVSGMHLSIWILLLGALLNLKERNRKYKGIILIFLVVFMMNFASFTGSVKRAGFMSILYLLGEILHKKSDSFNNLGFACMMILVGNPFSCLNISFMLSFLSTLSILLFGFPLSVKALKLFKGKEGGLFHSVFKAAITSLCVSLSVMVFTFPVCVFYFGGISLVSPLTNLLFFSLMTPLILLTGLYTFLRFVPFVSGVVAVVLKFAATFIIKTCEYFSSFDYAYVEVKESYLKFWFIGFAAVVTVYAAVGLYKKKFMHN